MNYAKIGKSNLNSSRLIYGCMRIVGDNSKEFRDKGIMAVRTAIEEGYNHFDHADIYGGGECERLFSLVLKDAPQLRDKLLITSKCGIRMAKDNGGNTPKRYDFSKEHIKKSVEGSLSRLNTDYLDILLLHRPDYLMDPDEVSEVFMQLHGEGKVKHFGVSNFSPSQLSLLQSCLDLPLIVNQVEINIQNISAITDGTLDQCRMLGISPQAWSPLAGIVAPTDGHASSERDKRISMELEYQSEKYQTEDWIILLAWLLKHPARIFPVIGTTNPDRIRKAKHSLELDYEREDWYRLLEARNGYAVP